MHKYVQQCLENRRAARPTEESYRIPNGKGILQNLLHILCNLLCGEVIVLQYLVYVIAVEELLLEAEVQHLNVGITVETRDLLSEAAVEYAVLEGDDHVVIRLEALEQVSIHAGDIVRVDKSRLYAGLFLDERRRLFTERVERTQTDDSDLCALLLNLVGVQPAEVLSNSLSVGNQWRRPACG